MGAAEGERGLIVVDLKAGRVIARIETGNRPRHPLVSPDGRGAVWKRLHLARGRAAAKQGRGCRLPRTGEVEP